ncbi:MAG: DMT family transporter [Anaerolineae bacterium]|nr:DMT family transporter [Anaerolineae bacterium]
MSSHSAVMPQKSNTPILPYIILMGGVAAFGFSAIFAHMADAPGFVVATWRVSVASVFLSVPYLRQPRQQRHISRAALRRLLIGGSIFPISLGVFHVALDYTSAANATFLGNVAPIWVGLITLLVLKRALPRLFWPGVAVSLGGAALIVFGDGGLEGVRSGDLIVLANSLVWGVYQLYTAHARARISTLTWVWGVVVISSLWLIPIALLSGYALTGYSAPTTWAMLGSGVITQSLGFIAYNYALGKIDAARVSVLNMLQPVVTAVMAYLLLAEPFGGLRLVGGALVLAGVYLVNRRQ